MSCADPRIYLADLISILKQHWPENRAVHVVCHGHSVPAGYFATPWVDTFNSYPHLLHVHLKQRFPFSVVNVIVTAVGGENSERGAVRFEREALCHRPDVVTLDYSLNDRGLGLERARFAWVKMIEMALECQVKVLLLTPTPDHTQQPDADPVERALLRAHADQVRSLADAYGVGLVDSLAAFSQYPGDLSDLLSWPNHPNRAGHDLVARELLRWFPADRPG